MEENSNEINGTNGTNETNETNETNGTNSNQINFTLSEIDFIQGESFTIEDDNIYILEFWATWCPPCKTCIPHLDDLYTKYKDQVKFVSITNGKKEDLLKFINKQS